MALVRKICLLFRIFFFPFFPKKDIQSVNINDQVDIEGQHSSDYIKSKLLGNTPLMVARFGSVELNCIVESKSGINFKNCFHYITHKTNKLAYSKSTYYAMFNNAGFFPVTKENLDKFSELMLDCMLLVDVLGSWQENELMFGRELQNAKKVPLGDLEPYFHKKPWSEALKGKKVLVIHPFEDSIKEQYKKHELLFKDKRILPDFELQTIKAIQSVAGNSCDFETWFDALEYMKQEIDKLDFDIALIGCGAYGFPLAAYVKSIGKKAIHLGGALQILFGIKGTGWNDRPKFQHLFNENWIYPNEQEKPNHFDKVESGRYW